MSVVKATLEKKSIERLIHKQLPCRFSIIMRFGIIGIESSEDDKGHVIASIAEAPTVVIAIEDVETVATNMVFTSLVVMVLAVIAIGFTRTLTPKFLSGKTTLTTSRLSRLELMVFALRVPANFLQSFCATIAITMVANSVRSVRITALKHGTFSIATASSFTSAKVVWTNIIAFVNTAKSISTKAK